MAFLLKYDLDYDDHFGVGWGIRILSDGYTGESSNFIGTGEPCVISMNTQDNGVFSAIRSMFCTINIRCTSVDQYDELLTSSNRQHRVDIYRESVLFFQGYIEQELCTRNLLKYNTIQIKAIDGIGFLKKIEFKNGSDFHTGYKSLYSCIWECLEEISDFTYIIDGCNIWSEDENQALSPLTQEYLDCRLLNDGTEAWSCYEVLDEILKIKLCRLFMYGGNWYVLPNNNSSGSLPIRYMNSAGTIASTSTLGTSVLLTDASGDNCPIGRSARIEKLPAYKEITVEQDFGFEDNLFMPIQLSDFNNGHPTRVDVAFDNNELKITELEPFTDSGAVIQYDLADDIPEGTELKIKIEVNSISKFDLLVYINIKSDITTQQLKDDGEWYISAGPCFTIDQTGSYSITSRDTLISGKLWINFKVIPGSTYGGWREDVPARVAIDCSTTSVKMDGDVNFIKKQTDTSNGNQDSFHVPSNYTILLGGNDLTDVMNKSYTSLIYQGLLYTYDSDYEIITNWIAYYGDVRTTLPMLGEALIRSNSKSIDKYHASILSEDLKPHLLFQTQGKIFSFNKFDLHTRTSIWDVVAYEVGRYIDTDYLELEDSSDYLELEGSSTYIEIE